jgi:glycosyltransferase involved in cell wall biosynthesis
MTEASGNEPASPPADREAALQAEADQWRAIAAERGAELRRLKRRPVVRVALAVDRRIEPGRRAAAVRLQRWRRSATRTAVAVGAVASLPARGKRRAALVAQLEQLDPPAPLSRRVSFVEPAAGAESSSLPDGDLVCFVPPHLMPVTEGWVERLADAIDGDVVAATPTLVHSEANGRPASEHELRVRCAGFDLGVGDTAELVPVPRSAGGAVDLRGSIVDVAAAPLWGLVVDGNAYRAVGGIVANLDDDDVAGIELCSRLRRAGGRIVHVPTAAVYDDRPVRSRAALYRPVDVTSAAWRAAVERQGPSLIRSARPKASHARRWVITTAAPSAKVAARWGDWYLAEGLAAALRRLGEDVVVETHDRADALDVRSRDLHLVLCGLASVRRTPAQRHILWIISHPESVAIEACDAADLVLVASTRFAAELRSQTATPVEELLQATDPNRFAPGPIDPAFQHPVVMVGKTRDVLRPIVADALAVGIRPAIYGGGWRNLVDPSLVVADHIPNEQLTVVYRSAGVVLNDHWHTMRAWGFVSNRIFDVLACGAPIISDHVPEIEDLLGDAVATYATPAELAELVDAALGDPKLARARADDGRLEVLAAHTFDHRARRLLELLEVHDLAEAPP